jgi:GWxTD domain-containing protein
MTTAILLIVTAVQWQTVVNPVTDSTSELSVFFQISQRELKYTRRDTSYFASYEIQLKILSRNGEQLAGDYWQRERPEDSTDISDSVRIMIPADAVSFDMRVIDLQAYEVVRISEIIKRVKFLGNLRWWIHDEMIELTFQVYNTKGEADKVTVNLGTNRKEMDLPSGTYVDSLAFPVIGLPNNDYSVKFEVFKNTKKLEETTLPVRIARPFYLDDKEWALRTTQLEYIGTSSKIARLKTAPVDERDSLWRDFWKEFDPTPNTVYNEREEEYFSRIAYCEEHFGHGDKGWHSDRAKIYVKLGPPDDIQSMPYELGSYPYEIWFYYRLNLKYYFVDRYGVGEYLLVNADGTRI